VQIRLIFALITLLLVVSSCPRSAAAFVRHTMDDQELLNVRTASPEAADDYEQAEARLRLGDWASADTLLDKARKLRPTSFLIARRHCQVLTELGQRDAAITACLVALSSMTAMDERAYVGALMSGKRLATPKDLADAVREASNARRLVGQPFADAAFCEIAHHIGDDAMYSTCLAGLEKNAPRYFETVRWRAARGNTPAWLYWVGWLLLAALAFATLLRAFLSWFRAPAPRASRTAAIVLLALSAFATSARAGESAVPGRPQHWQLSHFHINWDDPESNIPTIAERNADALEFGYFLQDLAAEAGKAEAKSDYQYAVKFWRASAKAVPDEAIGFSRACRDYQILDEREKALEYCSRALNLNGVTTEDYARFGELTIQKPGPLTTLETQDLDAAVAHLKKQENGAGPAAVLECGLGVKLDDEARLARCAPVLAKTAPNDPHTLTFEWALAMKRHDYSGARRLLDAMAKSPMTPAALAELRTATDAASAWWRRPFTDPRWGFSLLGLMGVVVVLVIRKRAQLRGAQPVSGAAPVA
jgi:tetratricopeptide (TPR) repeat protein